MMRWCSAAAAACVIVTGLSARAVTTSDESQARAQAAYGHDVYVFCCATCHGQDGSGHGATVGRLATAPADLTALARRNGGVFPAARVYLVLTGTERQVDDLGISGDMPSWRRRFLEIDATGILLRERASSLVDYLQSIQR